MEKYLKPLHLACINDETRINLALIEIKNGNATATNANMVVKIDLKKTCSSLIVDRLDVLEGKFIHMEVWKEMHKCDVLEFDENGIYVHKNGIKKTFEYSEPQGEFFKIDDVLRDVKESGEEAKRCVGFTADYIEDISKIFECSQLKFTFSKGNKGVIISPGDYYPGMFAMLMPVVLEDTNRYMFL